MANEELPARTDTGNQRSCGKEPSLSMRIFFRRHYTDLVRMVAHGLPESEGRQKIQPLIEQYGDAKMREAIAELVEIDRSHDPPIARLNERARLLAKALLGPPPPTVEFSSDDVTALPMAESGVESRTSSAQQASDRVERLAKAPRSSVIPRFLDHLRATDTAFDFPDESKHKQEGLETSMELIDVIVREPSGNWLIAVRRSLRPNERDALRRWVEVYGGDFRAANVWPVVTDQGWAWKRHPISA